MSAAQDLWAVSVPGSEELAQTVTVGHTDLKPFEQFACDVPPLFAVQFDGLRPTVFFHQALNHNDDVRPEGQQA